MSASSVSMAENPGQHCAREWAFAALVSFWVAMAVVTPFFFLGTAAGHDVAFHMASWLDAAEQWKQGVLFPRWTEWSNFGFGEPRFIFYPPLSWLFGAFLGTLLPWQAVSAVFIVILQLFAGLCAYALSRHLVDSRFAALLAAACYAANPYSLLVIYARSDFAELLAIAMFPALLLATLRLTKFLNSAEHRSTNNALSFAMWVCAIWLSNAPAAVIATYSVGFLFVLAAVRQHSIEPLKTGGTGMGLGFGLSSFYLIPAIHEQRWVNISGILSGGLRPVENFLYARTSDAEHDAFNRMASNIAVLLIVWAGCAALAACGMERAASPENRRRFILPASLLAVIATLLMLPVTKIFWTVLPEMRFLQFPWRWMSIVALCAVMFTAASARGMLRWGWLLIAAVAILGSGHYIAKHSWWDSDDMPALQAAMAEGSGFEGTDEYDPAGDDRTDLPQKAPRAVLLSGPSNHVADKDARIVIEKWAPEHRLVKVVAEKPGRIALHLLNYPAWRVLLNGNSVPATHPDGTQQMIIAIPRGESEVQIDFTRTFDRTLGGAISIFSLLVWLIAWFWSRPAPRIARS
jgi:hypothetical protein